MALFYSQTRRHMIKVIFRYSEYFFALFGNLNLDKGIHTSLCGIYKNASLKLFTYICIYQEIINTIVYFVFIRKSLTLLCILY